MGKKVGDRGWRKQPTTRECTEARADRCQDTMFALVPMCCYAFSIFCVHTTFSRHISREQHFIYYYISRRISPFTWIAKFISRPRLLSSLPRNQVLLHCTMEHVGESHTLHTLNSEHIAILGWLLVCASSVVLCLCSFHVFYKAVHFVAEFRRLGIYTWTPSIDIHFILLLNGEIIELCSFTIRDSVFVGSKLLAML